jgi:Collagen triple helix repeat (20 copies)
VNRRWGMMSILLLLLMPTEKAHGIGDTYLQVNLFPDIFSPSEAASLFACIRNSNSHYYPKILPGDRFNVNVGSSGGTVTSIGSVFVDAVELLPTDFAPVAGAVGNEMVLNYVGTTSKGLYPGESFCLETSFQPNSMVGPFEVSVNPPAGLGTYGDRLYGLGSVIDFPIGTGGSQGPQGPPGPQGPQGPRGATGLQGAQGPQGVVGPQGAAGVTGAQGSQGPAGPADPQGTTGAQGPQGPAGADGTSCTFRDAWNTADNYVVNDVVTDQGETWIAVAANTNSQPRISTQTGQRRAPLVRRGRQERRVLKAHKDRRERLDPKAGPSSSLRTDPAELVQSLPVDSPKLAALI